MRAEPGTARALEDLQQARALAGKAQTQRKPETTEFARLAFDLGGERRLSVLFKSRPLDPQTGVPADCHVCSVSLSAVDYALRDGSWVRVGQSPDFTELGSWGDADGSAVKTFPGVLADNTQAFLAHSGWTGQGLTDSGETILLHGPAGWKSLGYVSTAADNEGDCEQGSAKPCWNSSGRLELQDSATRGYKDIMVRMQGTAAGPAGSVQPARDVRYTLGPDGKYAAQEAAAR